MNQDSFYDDEFEDRPARSKSNEFYEEEDDERMDEPAASRDYDADSPYAEIIEANKDLLRLFNFLTSALENAPAVPFTSKRMVNADMCLDVVHNIRTNLPETVQQSLAVLEDRDDIIALAEREAANIVEVANARADNERSGADQYAAQRRREAEERKAQIIDDAEAEARERVQESEIVRRAQDEALRLHNEALADANEQRMEAARYADALLQDLERNVAQTLEAIRRSRQNIGK